MSSKILSVQHRRDSSHCGDSAPVCAERTVRCFTASSHCGVCSHVGVNGTVFVGSQHQAQAILLRACFANHGAFGKLPWSDSCLSNYGQEEESESVIIVVLLFVSSNSQPATTPRPQQSGDCSTVVIFPKLAEYTAASRIPTSPCRLSTHTNIQSFTISSSSSHQQ